MNIEIEKISAEMKALDLAMRKLDDRRLELKKIERDANIINRDETLRKDVDPATINYILGQSAGYVDGFTAAVDTIVEALASEYRDIPMTAAEMYVLVELGEMKMRAYLKNLKQTQIAEKAGWEIDFVRENGWAKRWIKNEEEKKEEEDDGD